ncbi:MAG TPA: serine/threonine-protein kinase [Candidatus Eisenbacteria bacterium]|nr:serine/threonine-protein kinase [Candidatus Eisenbacteria bacterium]
MKERWARVSEIFHAALERPPEKRAEYVKEACAGEPGLETEVRSLLESHESAGGYLEPAVSGAVTPPGSPSGAFPPSALAAGQTLGSWKVVRPLAEGGMGIVYLVEREDGQFRQRGALKLIRHGLATEEMVRRFRRERQILASLDHPNIARLLDGGATAEGLPWLVMEYVEGVPLYSWCSDHAPGLRDRLRLFLSLCGSVSSAHRRLVLHRDIKPSNVLVTSDGTPRLLDFGVAKIFSPDGIAPDSEITTLQAPLTPEYASPEQLSGREVSVASDVYSLGVLLFELVTGTRPYPTRSEGSVELVRTVLEKEPVRPSVAAAGTRRSAAAAGVEKPETRSLPSPPAGGSTALVRALSGDLDNIVLKALAKEPARRYGSVEELTADLGRYLDGRPVRARASTWSYRAMKFVRRNRVGVAMGSVTMIAILAGAGFSLWQARVAERERAEAERRLRDVTLLATTMIWDVNERLAEIPGTTPVRETIVDLATRHLSGISAEGIRDTALVRTLADSFDKLGTVQGYAWSANVGRSEEAYQSLKRAYELRESLVRINPAHEEYALDLASSATKLCNYDREHGKVEEAAAMSRRALELMTGLRAAHPDTRRYRMNIPRMLHNDGLTLIEAGRVEEGLGQIRRGLVEFAALAVWEPKEPGHLRALAQATTGYAEALVMQPGTADSALAALGRARGILTSLLSDAPGDVALRRRLGAVHYDTGRILLLAKEDAPAALREARAAASITGAAAAADPGNEDALVSDLIGRTFLGHALAAAGEPDAAERELNALLPALERRARADTTDVRFPQELIEARLGLGIAALDRAKRSSGAAAAEPASRARELLERARRDLERQSAAVGPWMASREMSAAIAKRLAECDARLAAARASN